MELSYPQKKNGIYILSHDAIEHIATAVLKDYSPCNLERPVPLKTIDFLENYLGLIVKERYIGAWDSGILGLIVMNDCMEIPSFDEAFNPTVLQECFGTVLISSTLVGQENFTRRRYTEVHEGSHFILHRPYYEICSKSAACRGSAFFESAACRKIEINGKNPKTDTEWMEWQADTLAASLLMPKDIFLSYARSVIRKYGVYCGYLTYPPYTNRRKAFEIITDIAETFRVSYRAAQIRMLHLELIQKPMFCC